MPVDVVLFGSHPDDVEWGAGGICLLMKKHGVSFALVDLTEGEMGSRGTTDERRIEAKKAAEFVGAASRENLGLPDCGLVDSPETRRAIAGVIRKQRPKLVMAPFWKDRHPDHAAAGRAVRHSSLYCTLTKLDDPNLPHKPSAFVYYLLHHYQRPTFVNDISTVYDDKLRLLRIHETQFSKTAEQLGLLPQGSGDYLFGLESRDRYFGSLVGVQHGEALITDRPMRLTGVPAVLSLLL
jgi:bacillithiol biosynthesis deacetylase BshB1